MSRASKPNPKHGSVQPFNPPKLSDKLILILQGYLGVSDAKMRTATIEIEMRLGMYRAELISLDKKPSIASIKAEREPVFKLVNNLFESLERLTGCFSAGDTLDEAMDNAVEAIELHLEALLHDHADIPHPSPLEVHSSNSDYAKWVFAVVEVDLAKLRSTTKRYNITMSERVMAMVDTAASQSGESRSAYLTKAAVMRVETDWVVSSTIPYNELNAVNDSPELLSGNEDADLRHSA